MILALIFLFRGFVIFLILNVASGLVLNGGSQDAPDLLIEVYFYLESKLFYLPPGSAMIVYYRLAAAILYVCGQFFVDCIEHIFQFDSSTS